MEQPRILVVEDDRALAEQIRQHLSEAGFAVDWWPEGRPFEAGMARRYALIICDLMLPGVYGMDLVKQVRAHGQTPVLMLSARNDTADKVRALKLGADDYMTKPFWPDELLERVRARLRRPALEADGVLEAHGLRLELGGRRAHCRGEPLELTRLEFDLLAALMRRAGAAVTRQWLVEHVLDPEREGGERTLDVHVSRLRRKLGRDRLIETVWGIGYRFAARETP